MAPFRILIASLAFTQVFAQSTARPPTPRCTSTWEAGCACYGAGGGHGVWSCGNSMDTCTAAGGVAHYAPGYVSSRSQCCMCAAGCTNEKGTDCDNTFRKTATINASPYMPMGALVGIIVGAVVGVALIAFLVYKFILKKKATTTKGAPDDGVTTTA